MLALAIGSSLLLWEIAAGFLEGRRQGTIWRLRQGTRPVALVSASLLVMIGVLLLAYEEPPLWTEIFVVTLFMAVHLWDAVAGVRDARRQGKVWLAREHMYGAAVVLIGIVLLVFMESLPLTTPIWIWFVAMAAILLMLAVGSWFQSETEFEAGVESRFTRLFPDQGRRTRTRIR